MNAVSLFEVEDGTLKAVAKILDQTEKSLNEDVSKIKTWIESQPHLPEIPNDNSLRNFLIRNGCSFETTKVNIDVYYTLRSKMSSIFETVNPKLPDIKAIMKAFYFVPLPSLGEDRTRVFFFKIKNKDLMDELDLYKLLALGINIQEIRFKEDVMLGETAIFDLQDISLKFFSKITPNVMQEIITLLQKMAMVRLGNIYVFNYPPIVEKLAAFVKTLIKRKSFERIHFCKDFDTVAKNFPMKLLPRDYGGEEKSLEELQELLQMKFDEYQHRFDKLQRLQIAENLRPKKLDNDDFLGFYGNFKKLEID